MILDEIAAHARARVAKRKESRPLEDMRERALAEKRSADFPFEAALRSPGLSFLCEVKKASPSKGIIAQDFPYLQIAKDYEQAGAAAVSVLTEPKWFLGDDAYLEKICGAVSIPVLRKDFTVDPYQIYEAKLLGASAVLLIAAILDDGELRGFLQTAHNLGLSALVEAHTQEEIERAVQAGARVIGVNNRDLKTFQVDVTASARLRALVPPDRIFVAESGVRTREDVKRLEDCGADAVLIGETLMRAPDKCKELARLRGMEV